MSEKFHRVFANSNLCTGCELCVSACSVSHHGINSRKLSGIHIKRDLFERYEIQFLCRHCDEPLCVISCISGAMQKDPDRGIVKNDPDLCVGCHTCVMVCPFDSIKIVQKTAGSEKLSVQKCDGCPSIKTPACVAVCPTKALRINFDF